MEDNVNGLDLHISNNPILWTEQNNYMRVLIMH